MSQFRSFKFEASGFGSLLLVQCPLLVQDLFKASLVRAGVVLGFGGEVVFGELFYGFGGLDGVLGEVVAGDLESVEEEASAAWVDLVCGDEAENFSDGILHGDAIFGARKVEGGVLADGAVFGGGFAGGVVVVAEVLVPERG